MTDHGTCPKCGVYGSVRRVGEGLYHCTDCGACWRVPVATRAVKKPSVPPPAVSRKGVG